MNRNIIVLLPTAALAVAAVAGCGSGGNANNADQARSATQLSVYQQNQPIPQAAWSQYRQTLVDVELAQIHGVATTSFFFNQGATDPYKSCPSIGFPVASTSQLTNPQQAISSHNVTGFAVIGQLEPNGTFTGESTGTYVVCVDPVTKTAHIDYAEGFVDTEGGPAIWDQGTHSIRPNGAATVTTSAGR